MTKSSRVIFFGNERLVSGLKSTDAPILRGLIERGYEVAAIVSSHSEGASRNSRSLEVAEIAKIHNIPLFLPKNPQDIYNDLEKIGAKAGILAAYGRIVPQRTIDLFSPVGIVNVHPSLLPRHRGPTPIETSILTGDIKTGVSIMQLTSGMDEGPVYGQTTLTLHGNETKFDVYESLSKMGADLLFKLLPDILSAALQPTPQITSDVSYTSLISKNDGIIATASDTAEIIERKVRAYLSYPKTRVTIKNIDVFITSSKVIDSYLPGKLVINCAGNTYLEITELTAPSGKTMSGEAFLRGYSSG